MWAVAFGLTVFGVLAVLARSPVSPGAKNAPLVTTVALFVAFCGGSVAFRAWFLHKWRVTHDRPVHGWRAQLTSLLSRRPEDAVEVSSSTSGSGQVLIESPDPAAASELGDGRPLA